MSKSSGTILQKSQIVRRTKSFLIYRWRNWDSNNLKQLVQSQDAKPWTGRSLTQVFLILKLVLLVLPPRQISPFRSRRGEEPLDSILLAWNLYLVEEPHKRKYCSASTLASRPCPSIHWDRGSHTVVPGPEAIKMSKTCQKMNSWASPYTSDTESETLGMEPGLPCFNKPSHDSVTQGSLRTIALRCDLGNVWKNSEL